MRFGFRSLALALFLTLGPSASPDTAGKIAYYDVVVEIEDIEAGAREATLNLRFDIKLSAGEGFTYLPLPFGEVVTTTKSVDLGSDYNLVLCGFIRPSRRFGACAISLLDHPSSLSLEFQAASVPLPPSTDTLGKSIVLELLFKEALKELEKFDSVNSLKLGKVEVRSTQIRSLEPSSRSRRESEGRYLILPSEVDRADYSDIYLTLQSEADLDLLYVVVGSMGVLIGLLGAPKLINSRSSAKWGAAISSIFIVAFIYFIFYFLTPDQRHFDSTVVATTGTVGGLILGILVSALNVLLKSKTA